MASDSAPAQTRARETATIHKFVPSAPDGLPKSSQLGFQGFKQEILLQSIYPK